MPQTKPPLKTKLPRRGDVYWVDFGGSQGGEVRKTRPAVIVSNDAANAVMNRVQVVPLTSQTEKVYPAEALVNVKGEPSKAMADQIATASLARLSGYMDTLSVTDMEKIERAILVQLGIRR